jgi:hypothetical protein
MNFLRNVSKLFKNDEYHLINSVNWDNVMLNIKILMNPTWVGPFG